MKGKSAIVMTMRPRTGDAQTVAQAVTQWTATGLPLLAGNPCSMQDRVEERGTEQNNPTASHTLLSHPPDHKLDGRSGIA